MSANLPQYRAPEARRPRRALPRFDVPPEVEVWTPRPELLPAYTRPRVVGVESPALNPDALPRFRPPLPLLPGYTPPPGFVYDPAEATRPRIARPAEHLRRRIEEEEAEPVADRNGRLKSALVGVVRGALQGLAAGQGLGGALGGAAVGAVHGGLVDRSFDERAERDARLARDRARLARLDAATDAEIARADRKAGVRLKEAQAGYAEARPDLEAFKLRGAEARREQQAVLSNLRLLKGQRLDSSNPTHAALLRRAADAGVIVDPDGWNDAASNQTLVEIVDPENPTQKRRALLNKATGELSDVGQSGYVQPVNTATGMTAAQAAADSDRDRSFGEARRMNDARLGQIGVQIERARRDLEGVSPAASREFQIATRGLNEQLNKKLAEVERWRKNVAEARVSPDAARERIERLEREIGEIQGRVESAREKALGRRGGGAPQRSSSPGGRFAGQRMSRSRLPEAARRMGVSEAEAERVIRAEGGEVY